MREDRVPHIDILYVSMDYNIYVLPVLVDNGIFLTEIRLPYIWYYYLI